MLLSSQVDFETGQTIVDLKIDGIMLEPIPIRIYPQGALMAQIVGFFAGADDSTIGRGYYGVEGFYQTLLAGQSKRVTTSTIPILDEERSVTSVRDGINLVLTIDRDLQNLAQDVLNDAVERYSATGGTILIMNPRNGRDSGDGELSHLRSRRLLTRKPGTAPATRPSPTVYEPGSVFKVLTMAMALEAGTHDLNWTYYDPGLLRGVGVHDLQLGPRRRTATRRFRPGVHRVAEHRHGDDFRADAA